MGNVQHSSESNEHYTPIEIVDAARVLMSGIDLDPASSKRANRHIRARKVFTKASNGLRRSWKGHDRVFLNPPGGIVDEDGVTVIRGKDGEPGCTVTGACGLAAPHEHHGVTSSARAWWEKLSSAWALGHIKTAFFVGFSLEILQSTQPGQRGLIPLQFPCCYPSTRLRFLVEQEGRLIPGTQPTHANVLVYLPREWSTPERRVFHNLFSDIGHCVWPATKLVR